MGSNFGIGNASIVRVGIVPLSDCAPIAVAQELGIFKRYGLNVRISKELGWASVREKIYYGQLDAAQSVAGIAMALGLGIDKLQCDVVVPLILSLHGNAITLSKSLSPEQVGSGEGLKNIVAARSDQKRPLTMAVPHRYSSHHILLHDWLHRHGLVAGKDVEVVFLPPPIMAGHLAAGLIDGYCVGEPWNSRAILRGNGWCPAVSVDVSHGHPEKVLLVAGRFLGEHPEKTAALVAALIEACAQCQAPEFSDELISILSRDEYVGIEPEVLRNSFKGAFDTGAGSVDERPFYLFKGDEVNRPTMDKASWQLTGLRKIGALQNVDSKVVGGIHREDIYDKALKLIGGG